MIPTHPASLVSAAQHSPAILDILDAKVSRNVVAYVVEIVSDAVDHAFSKQGPSRGRSTTRRSPAFTDFASRVLANADVPLSTVLVTIAYIQRAKPYLSIALEEWACERVFLGALVVAAKYTNDSTLKNAHWAACTQVFSTNDVSRVEREFLDVMAFELSVSEAELLPHCAEIADRIHITDDHHHARPARATATPASPSKRTSSPSRATAKWPHVKLPQPPKLPEFIRKSSGSSSTSSASSNTSSASSSASSSSSRQSTSTSATSLSTSPSRHRCPELSPHASDSDETASSPASVQILTPPSATAGLSHPPGIPIPLAKVSSQAGPERASKNKKRHSPLFPRLRSALHFHGHHHSPESRHARHSIAVGGRF